MAKTKKQKRKTRKNNSNNRPKLPITDRILFFLTFIVWIFIAFIGFIIATSIQFPLLKYFYGNDIIYGKLNASVFIVLFFTSLVALVIACVVEYESVLSYKIPFKDFFKGGQEDYTKAKKEFIVFAKYASTSVALMVVMLTLSSLNCTTINESGIVKHYTFKQDEIVFDYTNVDYIEIVAGHQYSVNMYGRETNYSFYLNLKNSEDTIRLDVPYFNDKYETMDVFLSKFDKNIIHISDKSYKEAKELFPYGKELIDKYK